MHNIFRNCEYFEMYWARSNRRFGSWAALFALTIQLVLSFGHIHLQDIQVSSAAIAAPSQAQPDTPADDDRGTGGHDFCAICATLNLTSSSILPTVSLPATPVDQPHRWIAEFQPTQVSYRVHFLFQARAPPHSI
jgi:hypothetical protein